MKHESKLSGGPVSSADDDRTAGFAASLDAAVESRLGPRIKSPSTASARRPKSDKGV